MNDKGRFYSGHSDDHRYGRAWRDQQNDHSRDRGYDRDRYAFGSSQAEIHRHDHRDAAELHSREPYRDRSTYQPAYTPAPRILRPLVVGDYNGQRDHSTGNQYAGNYGSEPRHAHRYGDDPFGGLSPVQNGRHGRGYEGQPGYPGYGQAAYDRGQSNAGGQGKGYGNYTGGGGHW
ncbi:uncharacterized protein LOC129596522 isoform X2 [Paramacrobiotus metropolitanus]|uniref:uncharacterized protein LOC129596522 isoform X2 n=1 Tax=Paramacrobiotus metropolitanus TaxID=2943436 RepID=UPI002445748F|nr:uncharacterized protein LOC129596522 isoform X2 [Paramacrobiotus metropolitanus]